MISGNSIINPTIATKCAICESYGNSKEIYPPNLLGENLDEKAFSARRFYGEKIHFRMVECLSCGLLRSDPIIDPSIYSDLYLKSELNYDSLIPNLKKTYGYYLKKIEKYVLEKKYLLEIGCGNGFFLEVALEQGYSEVFGVEPSVNAIKKAKPHIQKLIKKEMFNRDSFPQNSFDCICIFQTLDHLLDPVKMLSDALYLLKPGGVLLTINHNLKSVSAKILGEKSPIIDIEHTYLYDKETITKLFEKSGFRVEKVFYPYSRHSLGYLFSLLPIKPLILKKAIHKILDILYISNIPLFIPIGNLGVIAEKKR